ncbi:MAG TPA: sialate O-acetylesterase, partial [Pseudorhizobium sp.]|nr:sialate O-acetylesterase [Pseudorhizobium sp.]
MANEIIDAFRTAWDTGPASDPYSPRKEFIWDIAGKTVQDQVDALGERVDSVNAGYVRKATWSELAGSAGTKDGQPGEVVNDSGTHTDPVVGGTVPNEGVYTWSASPAGWRRVADTGITSLEQEVEELGSRPIPTETFSDTYAAVLASDENERVHHAIRHDGSIHPLEPPAHKPFIAYVSGSSPSRKVIVERDDGTAFEVAGGFEGDAYNPAMAGAKCRYYVNRGGRVYLEYQEMEPTAGLDPDVTTIAHIVTYGQSLAVGAYSGALLNPTPTFAARALMFKSGIRTLDLDHSPVYRDRRQDVALLDHLTDAYEKIAGNYGETGWARMAAAVLAGANALSAAHAALVTAHGIGASSYNSLKKGTVPYTNLLVGVRRAFNASRLLGMAYRLPAVIFVQGEGNAASTSATDYRANLEELQANLDADIKAITGQSEDVKLIIDQLSSWTRSGVATSGVPIGQLDAAKANPTKIFLVGPKYALAYASDGQHMTATGYARHAEEVARAWRAIQAGA